MRSGPYRGPVELPKRIFVILAICAAHGCAQARLLAGVLPGVSLTVRGAKPLLAMADRPQLFYFCHFFRRLFGVAPARLVGTIAPCAWAIEGMHPELVDLLHLIDPVPVSYTHLRAHETG